MTEVWMTIQTVLSGTFLGGMVCLFFAWHKTTVAFQP